MVKEINVYFY